MILLIGMAISFVVIRFGAIKYQNINDNSKKDILILSFTIVLGVSALIGSICLYLNGDRICKYEMVESNEGHLSYNLNSKGYDWKMTGTIRSVYRLH